MRDNRDPLLLAVELAARRRPGESLSAAADRLAGVDIPGYGTPEAVERMKGLNGSLDAAYRMFSVRK